MALVAPVAATPALRALCFSGQPVTFFICSGTCQWVRSNCTFINELPLNALQKRIAIASCRQLLPVVEKATLADSRTRNSSYHQCTEPRISLLLPAPEYPSFFFIKKKHKYPHFAFACDSALMPQASLDRPYQNCKSSSSIAVFSRQIIFSSQQLCNCVYSLLRF